MMIGREKSKKLGKKIPQCHFDHQEFHKKSPGIESGPPP
jgi:hypothetical protein